MADSTIASPHDADDEETRRDFLLIATSTVAAIGTAFAAWPFIDSLNPAKDTLAVAITGVDLSPVAEGQAITVVWQGKPVFIRHRTAAEIAAARDVVLEQLTDPQPDSARAQKPEWLVLIGVCTHLGCIPLGQKATDVKGEYGGWFCPCHGSHYDSSGRIRKGPAPKNLEVPPYRFLDDNRIEIG